MLFCSRVPHVHWIQWVVSTSSKVQNEFTANLCEASRAPSYSWSSCLRTSTLQVHLHSRIQLCCRDYYLQKACCACWECNVDAVWHIRCIVCPTENRDGFVFLVSAYQTMEAWSSATQSETFSYQVQIGYIDAAANLALRSVSIIAKLTYCYCSLVWYLRWRQKRCKHQRYPECIHLFLFACYSMQMTWSSDRLFNIHVVEWFIYIYICGDRKMSQISHCQVIAK